MTRPGRIRCEAIGCRRTADAAKHPPKTIICCGKCWRLGAKERRVAWTANRRERTDLESRAIRFDITGWPIFDGVALGLRYCAVLDREHELWAAILAEVNEARAGIA